MSEPTSLASALALAQSNARAVFKDAKNDHHGYKYADAESIIEESRTAISTVPGLSVSQTATEIVWLPIPIEYKNESNVRALARCSITSRFGAEREQSSREWPVLEQKGRPFDKAVAGALTTALAYALRDLLLLPRDDDFAKEDRMDRRNDTEAAPASPPPKQEQAAQEQPKPAQAGPPEALRNMIETIASKKNEKSVLDVLISSAGGLNDAQREACRVIATAYYSPNADEIKSLAATIREKRFPSLLEEFTIEEVKKPWRLLREQPNQKQVLS